MLLIGSYTSYLWARALIIIIIIIMSLIICEEKIPTVHYYHAQPPTAHIGPSSTQLHCHVTILPRYSTTTLQ